MVALGAADWMAKVRAFRHSEQCRLKDGSYAKLRSEHRSLLLSMMAEGDVLVRTWKLMPEMPKMPFTVEDIEATFEGLVDTFVCEHRPTLSPERKAHILASFNES